MTPYYFSILFVCSLMFGCVTGAYFTTAEYRILHKMPLITDGCYCPSCGHRLSVFHQIPIISWLFLHGKCYYCKCPISLRYPLTEGIFLLYYGLTFLFFWRHPVIVVVLWFVFLTLSLLIRCHKKMAGLFRGLLIFFLYHLLYITVTLCIYASLGLI